MKFTRYFMAMRERPDRKDIRLEWIQCAIDGPFHERVQQDGRLRRWVYIDEVGRYLRVVLLADAETVHNAFFDRRFSE